jgi:hypothetical protein
MSVFSYLTTGVGKTQTHEARHGLYRSQQARLDFWRAAVVASFFIVVAGASLFLGAVIVIGTIRGVSSSNELTADGRTGRIARTLHDGTLCHYIVFDNKTAQAVEDRIGRCDEGKPKPKPEKPPMFKWGGQ